MVYYSYFPINVGGYNSPEILFSYWTLSLFIYVIIENIRPFNYLKTIFLLKNVKECGHVLN